MSADWGEEVMGGVFMMRRSQIEHQAQLSRMAEAAGVAVEYNFEKIYSEIQETQDLVRRLEASNRQMKEYLAEEGHDSSDAHACDGELVERGDDSEVVDAIAENELIIKQKKKELMELLSLVSMHKCGHDHGEHDAHGSFKQDDDAEDSDSDNDSDSGDDDAPVEEGGHLDNGDAMCLAQLSSHAARNTRFSL